MIRKAKRNDRRLVAELALLLWPYHSLGELEEEFEPLLASEEAGIFVQFVDDRPVGFAQCQLRHDYVEGTESSPVGYLEGIFIEEAYRGRGLAWELLETCEMWAQGQGCSEFASDCEWDNEASRRFHMKTGFAEAKRIICFAKKL